MAEPGWTPAFAGDVPCRDGIYRGLSPTRAAEIEPFLRQYRQVRQQDGYRQRDAAYYRGLPQVDRGDPQASVWQIRQESFDAMRRLLNRSGRAPLRVLDLGTGNGWLSNRLTFLGHRCLAVDWLDDAEDGLGAVRHYERPFPCLQADFDRLPLAPGQFDVVVFNASLHYAPDPPASLRRARHFLDAGGSLVVMDSPVFSSDVDGRRMVAERQAAFAGRLGSAVDWGAGYLTDSGLRHAAIDAGLSLRHAGSRGRRASAVRRWFTSRRLGRAPARFGVWTFDRGTVG